MACVSGNDDDGSGGNGGARAGTTGTAGTSSSAGGTSAGGAGSGSAGTSSASVGGGVSAGSGGVSGGSAGSAGVSSGGTATGGASAGSGGTGTPVCAEEGLMVGMTAAHNAVRATVSENDPLPTLEWSCDIAEVAQAWAEELALDDCPLDHSGNEDYGENIYWRYSDPPTDATPQQVVGAWADEEACYSYGQFPNQCTPIEDVCGDCGHYTQMVWRDTLRVGCGTARCGKAELWVCNYDPAGNFGGEYPY